MRGPSGRGWGLPGRSAASKAGGQLCTLTRGPLSIRLTVGRASLYGAARTRACRTSSPVGLLRWTLLCRDHAHETQGLAGVRYSAETPPQFSNSGPFARTRVGRQDRGGIVLGKHEHAADIDCHRLAVDGRSRIDGGRLSLSGPPPNSPLETPHCRVANPSPGKLGWKSWRDRKALSAEHR